MSDLRETTIGDAYERLHELVKEGCGPAHVTALIVPQASLNRISEAVFPRRDSDDKRPPLSLHYGTMGRGGLQINPTETLMEAVETIDALTKSLEALVRMLERMNYSGSAIDDAKAALARARGETT